MDRQLYLDIHPNSSSTVYLSDDGKSITKERPRGNPAATSREFKRLQIWHDTLQQYHDPSAEYNLISPKPLYYDEHRGSVAMTFCPGVPADRLLEKRHGVDVPGHLHLCSALAYLAGRLIAIKSQENLMHGDFTLRHLLTGPTGDLAVIDVEWSRKGSASEVEEENYELKRSLLMTALTRLSPPSADQFTRNLQEGLNSL